VLPISELRKAALRNVGLTLMSCVGFLVASFRNRSSFQFDLLAVFSGLYIPGLFIFQNCYTEWPKLTPKVLSIVAAGQTTLIMPSIMRQQGLWQETPALRWLFRLADVALLSWTYRTMVSGPQCQALPPHSLDGETAIITGCNTGIGFEAAITLAKAGCRIVFACRSEGRAKAAMENLVALSNGSVKEEQLLFLPLDVSSLASVRSFVEKFQATGLMVDKLILNAGVMLPARTFSVDHIEMTMASNHVGHFLLVQLLVPALLEAEKKGRKPRIVCVGSNMCYMHGAFDFPELLVCKGEEEKAAALKRPYGLFPAYGQSKLANLCFIRELDRRLREKGSNIAVVAVHPGEVMTDMMRHMDKLLLKIYAVFRIPMHLFLKTPKQGAACTLHAATSPLFATAEGGMSGAYLVRLEPAPVTRVAADPHVAAKLWDVSMRISDAPATL